MPRAAAAWALALAACAPALTACAPDYNWREIRPPATGYAVMLPGKPASMSRPIDLDGLAVTMAMSGARVGEQSFTVGVVVLPDAQAATRAKAGAAMRVAMVRNIAGRERIAAEAAVPVVDPAGRPVATQAGVRIEASGQHGDRALHLSALFVARGNRAWQAVVLGPEPDRAHAQVFTDSFRILE
jgi:hypothetical protein